MSLVGRRTTLPDDLLVHRVFEAHARRHPDRTALTCGEQRLSYAELNERANRFAHYCIGRGVGPGAVVGVCLDRTPDLMTAILGILKAGAAYVPLDPTYPAERLRLMVSQLDNLTFCAVSADTVDLVDGAPGGPVLVDSMEEELAALPVTDPQVAMTDADLCYVVFTSGSTGTPKAIAVRHDGWYNLLEWLRAEYGLGPDSAGLTVSSFGFDISQRGLMSPLFCGAAIHLLPSRFFDAGMAYRLIATHGVRQLHCAPSTLYVLIEYEGALGGDALTKVGHVFIGGEPLNVARVEEWATRPGNTCVLLHQYGVAECTDVATSHVLTDYRRYRNRAAPVGVPVHNTEVRLLDEELNEVPDGETGEIYISGRSVSAGYLNASPADRQRFLELVTPDGPVRIYRTGDRGYVDPAGELVVVGRADAQVKIRGMRMDLGDVEHGLRSHELVDDAVVLALPDDTGELSLVGFIRPSVGATCEPRALTRDLLKVLPRNMVPQQLTLLDAFPLNPNGKTDRLALASMART
jgi:amino acid adenylation domain-containing protein